MKIKSNSVNGRFYQRYCAADGYASCKKVRHAESHDEVHNGECHCFLHKNNPLTLRVAHKPKGIRECIIEDYCLVRIEKKTHLLEQVVQVLRLGTRMNLL